MTKAIDLSVFVQKVWSARSLDEKKTALLALIESSHAKADTKRKYTNAVAREFRMSKLDSLASNYMMSGEGMKVG